MKQQEEKTKEATRKNISPQMQIKSEMQGKKGLQLKRKYVTKLIDQAIIWEEDEKERAVLGR